MRKKVKKNNRDKVGKKILFILPVDPYSQQCLVVCNGTFVDAHSYLKNINNGTGNLKEILNYLEENKKVISDEWDRDTAALFTNLPTGYLMKIRHKDDWRATVAEVAHETLHLVQYVLRKAGLKEAEDSEEAYTYLLGNILEMVLREIY